MTLRRNRQAKVNTCRVKTQQWTNHTVPPPLQCPHSRSMKDLGPWPCTILHTKTSHSFIDFTFHNSISLKSNGSKKNRGWGGGQASHGRMFAQY